MKKMILAFMVCFMFAVPVQAMVTTNNETGVNYKIAYPVVKTEDVAVQTAINEDIEKYLQEFRTAMEKGVEYPGLEPGYRLHYRDGHITWQLRYEDADVLSLTMTEFRDSGGAHGSVHIYGLNYDKHTGVRLPLSHFVKLTPADVNAELNENLYSGTTDKRIAYSGKTAIAGSAPFKAVPGEYYILPDKGIAIQLQVYEATPYSEGAPTIRLDAERLAQYNDKNR